MNPSVNNMPLKTLRYLVASFFLTIFVGNASAGIPLTPSCIQYRVLGCCDMHCTSYVINHYLPVLLIEVVNKPGDSVFASPVISGVGGASGGVTGNTRIAKHHEQGFEVRVWEISSKMRKAALGPVACAMCEDQYAKFNGYMDREANPPDPLLKSGSKQCGGDKTLNMSLDKLTEISANTGAPKLVYSTELDPINWRTGCRDMQFTAAKGPQIAVTCNAIALKSAASDVMSSLGFSYSANTSGPEEMCVGTWGPNYPRQYRSYNTDITGAAHEAYRAIHIASRVLKKNKYAISGGKLQAFYPSAGQCFAPGANPAEVDQKVRVSHNGKYGFIWWVPVTCCKSLSQMASCKTSTSASAGSLDMGGFPEMDSSEFTGK